MERGINAPSFEALEKLAEVLDISFADLFDFQDSSAIPERKAEDPVPTKLELVNIVEREADEDNVVEAELQFINSSAQQVTRAPIDIHTQFIKQHARKEYAISEIEVRDLISLLTALFKLHLLNSGYEPQAVQALITKFRDAGRRSAPWQPTSKIVPGRPQHGADGNRQSRWLFSSEHKFYANEIDATLVEVKYFLQTLSMAGAPPLPPDSIQESFHWLLGHSVEPGQYLDPIQLIPIQLSSFINDRRSIQSGHLTPLDRGGRHVPSNTFLMLARSNQIQGNQTLDELLKLMERVILGYQERRKT
jgi:transcriptional regulator with XRE-family HTH domain